MIEAITRALINVTEGKWKANAVIIYANIRMRLILKHFTFLDLFAEANTPIVNSGIE